MLSRPTRNLLNFLEEPAVQTEPDSHPESVFVLLEASRRSFDFLLTMPAIA